MKQNHFAWELEVVVVQKRWGELLRLVDMPVVGAGVVTRMQGPGEEGRRQAVAGSQDCHTGSCLALLVPRPVERGSTRVNSNITSKCQDGGEAKGHPHDICTLGLERFILGRIRQIVSSSMIEERNT